MATQRHAVVDASVALKWQLDDEEDVQAARALRDDYIVRSTVALSAPTLFRYEITNGIWAAALRARLKPAIAREALRNLLDCDVETREPDPERVLDLSLKHDVAAYDAAYLAVAESLGAELWTADRALLKATKKSLAWVRWIGEYTSES